eukprot:TRINITY_DN5215_c0_g1_i2.p1 TRINITY_DN5215_c0_g1~~TRINITY_DN5215_c0_g1_i2.p1  ORF type:complete len:1364 (+),score=425.85 TRINITY_DN5215_c0_g1_i2:121-4212(+)
MCYRTGRFEDENCTDSDFTHVSSIDDYSTGTCFTVQRAEKVALVKYDTAAERMTSVEIVDHGQYAGKVLDIAIDERGDQLFVSTVLAKNGGWLYRVQLSTLAIRGVTHIPEGDPLLYSLKVQDTERLLWALTSPTEVQLVPYLLYATESVTPYLSHMQGGTLLTITGMAFVSERGPQCRIGNKTVLATVYNSTRALCRTESSLGCLYEDVSLSVRDGKYAHDPLLKVRRVSMPVIEAVYDEMTPTVIGTDVTVEGKDFIPSEFARCSFSFMTDTSMTSMAKIVPPDRAICPTPISRPKGVKVSLDGQVFSTEFLFQREPVNIVTNNTEMNSTMLIMSAEKAFLDPITVKTADKHMKLSGARDVKRHTICIEMVQTTGIKADLLTDTECTTDGRPCVTTVDGNATFCDLWFERPLKGVAFLNVFDVDGVLHGATVLVVVDPGEPYRLSTPELSTRQLREGATIGSTVTVLDISGNVLPDGGRVNARFIAELSPGSSEYTAIGNEYTTLPIEEFAIYDVQGTKVPLAVISPSAPEAAWLVDGDSTTTYDVSEVVVGAKTGGSLNLDTYEVIVDPSYSLLRWQLMGSTDNVNWSPVDNHVTVDMNDSSRVPYKGGGLQVTYLKLTVVKGVDRGQVGVNEDGVYSFSGMHPEPIIHGKKYKLRYLGVGLVIQTVDSAYFTTAACGNGSYQLRGTGICKPCPEHAECDGTEDILPKEGYWRYGENTTSFYACPLSHACLQHSCANHTLGVLCADCEVGWGRNTLQGTCTECGSYVKYSVVIGPLICALALVGWMMAHILKSGVSIQILFRILLDHAQLLSNLAHVSLPFPNNLHTFFKTATALSLDMKNFQEFDCYVRENGLSSLDFFTICLLIPLVSVPIALAVWVLHAMWVWRKSKTFEGHYLKEKQGTLKEIGPREDGEGWINLVNEVGHSTKRLGIATTPQILGMCFTSIIYLLYGMLLHKAAVVLDCIDVESRSPCQGNETDIPQGCVIGGEDVRYLRFDPQVQCDGSYRKYEFLASVFLALYSVVMPAAFFAAVRVYQAWYGYGAATVMFPLISEGYQQEFTYWGILVMIRKGLAVLLTVFSREVTLQAYLMTWIVMLMALAQAWFQPFVEPIHNTFETMCLLAVILDLNVGLFFMIEEDNYDYRFILSNVALVLNFVMPLAVVFNLCKRSYESYKEKNTTFRRDDRWNDIDGDVMQLLGDESCVGEFGIAPPPMLMGIGKGKKAMVAMGGDSLMVGKTEINFDNIVAVDSQGSCIVLDTLGGPVSLETQSSVTADSWVAYISLCLNQRGPLLETLPVTAYSSADQTEHTEQTEQPLRTIPSVASTDVVSKTESANLSSPKILLSAGTDLPPKPPQDAADLL